MRTLRQHVETRLEALRGERSSWMPHWAELGDYLLPRRGRFLSTEGAGGAARPNQGGKRNGRIVNGTGTIALRTLQSGLSAGVTSPARPRFKLTVPDPELAEWQPVKLWLEQVERLMQAVFDRSNLYPVLQAQYEELGCFGTAVLAVFEDHDDVIRVAEAHINALLLPQRPTAPSTAAGQVALYARAIAGESLPLWREQSDGPETLLKPNIVTATHAIQVSNATGNFASSGLEVAITPRFSGKVIVAALTNGRTTGTATTGINGAFRLQNVTTGTTLARIDQVLQVGSSGSTTLQGSVHLLGTQSGLSIETMYIFQVQLAVDVGSSVSAQYNNETATIFAWEIPN